MTQQRKLAILLLKRAKKETQITKFHIFGRYIFKFYFSSYFDALFFSLN
jgi:hypothetical protein